MPRVISTHALAVLLASILLVTATANAQTTWYVDDDAPGDPGPGDPSVSDPLEDGSAAHPFDAIQEGIDAAIDADTVLVLDGTYTGDGNRDLDFGGRLIRVRSENGAENCVIDCEGSEDDPHRGFYFHRGETTDAVVDGFTIRNGWAGYYAPGRGYGGGINCESSSPTITNCTILGNRGGFEGGGVSCFLNSPTIINCKILGNRAGLDGGGISSHYHSNPTIANCILSADSAPGGAEIALSDSSHPSSLSVLYSDVEGGVPGVLVCEHCTLVWGPGNIDANPLFVDPNNGDYRLAPGSPCIDAANNDAVPADTLDLDGDGDTDEPIPFDLDGNPRFVDDPDTDDTGNGTPPIVDMGAYEFQAAVVAPLDIKPGSCPNPLNRNSHGVLPVAIVGAADLDVTQIDVDTLVLTRADSIGGSVPPLMGPPGPGIRVEDVATAFEGEPCECHELGGDGVDDLSMRYDTEVVVAELQLNDLPGGAMVQLVVSGELSDGTPFTASDCVRLVPANSRSGPEPAGPDGGNDGRDVRPENQRPKPAERPPAGDSSEQDPDAGEPVGSSASGPDKADSDHAEDAQGVLDMPLAACGVVSPGLVLAAIAGMRLIDRRRHWCG